LISKPGNTVSGELWFDPKFRDCVVLGGKIPELHHPKLEWIGISSIEISGIEKIKGQEFAQSWFCKIWDSTPDMSGKNQKA
jgi:hypothetical protein